MVSLGDESRRSGGHFFGTEPHSDAETDDLLRDPDSVGSIHRGVPVRFQRICTVFTTPVVIVLLVCLEVAVFLLPHCDHLTSPQPFSLLLYSHVFIWLIVFLADRLARWQHHLSRKQGYLEFYRHTCNLRRLPLFIVSIGNAVLLILLTLMADYCVRPAPEINNATSHPTTATPTTGGSISNVTTPVTDTYSPTLGHTPSSSFNTDLYPLDSGQSGRHTPHCLDLPLKRENYLQIVFSVEMAVLLPILVVYLVKVVIFNRRATSPDVLEQDISTTSVVQAQSSPMEIGFSEDPCMEEVMEKQAEMIRYLKEHNAALGRRVMELTALKTS